MLVLQCLLLSIGATLAILWGPFHDGDSGHALVTGMVLVAAMAIQNAAQRIGLANAPPTTIMTGTTTQLMIDLADLALVLPEDQRRATRTRLGRLGASVAAFASGCALAALLYARLGVSCLIVPPGLAATVLGLQVRASAQGH